jgi:hypothetical protein
MTAVAAPTDAVVGPDGASLYYVGSFEFDIRRVDPNGIVRQVAGNSLLRYCGDGRAASTGSALLDPQINNVLPGLKQSAVSGADGDVYVAEPSNGVVRKRDAHGALSTVVGVPHPCTLPISSYSTATPPTCSGPSSGDGDPAAQASLGDPVSLAWDGRGLYIADLGDFTMRYANFSAAPVVAAGITVDPGDIATVVRGEAAAVGAGNTCSYDPYNLSALADVGAISICAVPFGVAVDGQGGFYFTDYDRNGVFHVDAHGTLTLVAGEFDVSNRATGDPNAAEYGNCSQASQPATTAQLCGPGTLALDDRGNLYLSQYGAGLSQASGERIDYINLGSTPETVNGVSVPSGYLTKVAGKLPDLCSQASPDGTPAQQAGMCSLAGVATVGGAVLYSDSWNALIREVDTQGIVHTLAGGPGSPPDASEPWGFNPQGSDFSGDGGRARDATMLLQGQLSVAPNGALLFSDDGDLRVREILDCSVGGTLCGVGAEVPEAPAGAVLALLPLAAVAGLVIRRSQAPRAPRT